MSPAAVQDGLAMYRVGDGEPILLFPYPHATTLSSIARSPLADLLSGLGRSVFAFDPPAAYASTRSAECTPEEMCACAQECMDAMIPRATVDVIGHSMGAFCALAFALEHPERVRRLILVGAPSGFPAIVRWGMPHNWRWWRDREWWQVGWWGARIMLGVGNLEVHKRLSNVVEKASYADPIFAPYWTIQKGDRKRPAPRRTAWQANVRRYDLIGRLPELRVPVLLLYSRRDPQTPPQIADQMHSLLPHSQLVWFEASGHSPFVEEPDAFRRAVFEFLA